jgi:glycosyltransferase involved in cell wall biosynthesis
MLCFSHDWTGDPLSKTHLMRILSRDNRILWVNSIGYRAPTVTAYDFRRAIHKLKSLAAPMREVEPNLFVLNPLAIPAYGLPGMQRVNRELLRLQVLPAMRKLGFRNVFNWVFNPAAGVVAGSLGEDTVVYYCVDEFSAFSGVPKDALADLERDLMRKAALVIVSADRLYQSKKHENPHTFLVRHGVDYAHFSKALDPALEVNPEIAKLPRPIIGYFGLMAKDWIDIELMARVARHFSGGSLVLLGNVTTDVSALSALPNVHLLGRKAYSALPSYCKGFDAAILPFPISEVTLNANPLKVREYLAAGVPVVSTAIPEVEVLGQCRIGRDHASFITELEGALAETGSRAERSERVRGESWDARVEQIRQHVAEVSAL